MRRITIIGNAGGGKSTLALRLAERHALPYVAVDRIQWLPGWVEREQDLVTKELDQIATGDDWIIDGWGAWPCIERRLARSDTIIFVDLPLWMHFWFAAERQIAVARGEKRVGHIEGCDDTTVTRHLFELIWKVNEIHRPRLIRLLEKRPPTAAYHHVTDLAGLEALSAS
jgi:adenylate kinase family enzyme